MLSGHCMLRNIMLIVFMLVIINALYNLSSMFPTKLAEKLKRISLKLMEMKRYVATYFVLLFFNLF